MSKVVRYQSLFRAFPDILQPIKAVMPKWYKDTPVWLGNTPQVHPVSTKTMKQCAPFLDTLTTGYAVILPVDVLVKKEQGAASFQWMSSKSMVMERDGQMNSLLPIPEGHLRQHFAWLLPLSIKLPKGYSALITHPLNRFDLPFTTLSGIIDGDFALVAGGNTPFFLKDNFEGVIPQGTPIAQVLPFKMENWNSTNDMNLVAEGELNAEKSNSLLIGWYKKNIWQKKSFN